jgi:hypothetical protein
MKRVRYRLIGAAIREMEAEALQEMYIEDEKNPNSSELETSMRKLRVKRKEAMSAAESGRLGGLKGGPARAAKMTPEERRLACSVAAKARWAMVKDTEEAREKNRAKALRSYRKKRAEVVAARRAAGLPLETRGRPRTRETRHAEIDRMRARARYATKRSQAKRPVDIDMKSR